MSVNDPIADFLTRIRNAHMAKHETVEIPHSRMKAEIARILQEEGYVQSVAERGSGVERRLVITLKYGPDGRRGIASTASRPAFPACSTASGWRYSRPPRGS
jgi:small subunit ribosomal protein S8